MTFPFYVSPEQVMKDRADFARKGIARGRSVVVLGYEGGIAFATENPSRALHKIGEIYDRIAFAAVGKYNEFESLRVAGVRYADVRGYAYDRSDVTARGLAGAYAQTMGAVFTTEAKPLEVEVVVAELGHEQDRDQIYRLSYDGAVAEVPGFVVIGGDAERLHGLVAARWRPGLSLAEALALAVRALAAGSPAGPPSAPSTAAQPAAEQAGRRLEARQLEVAVLDRTRLDGPVAVRTFRRLTGALLDDLLPGEG